MYFALFLLKIQFLSSFCECIMGEVDIQPLFPFSLLDTQGTDTIPKSLVVAQVSWVGSGIGSLKQIYTLPSPPPPSRWLERGIHGLVLKSSQAIQKAVSLQPPLHLKLWSRLQFLAARTAKNKAVLSQCVVYHGGDGDPERRRMKHSFQNQGRRARLGPAGPKFPLFVQSRLSISCPLSG